MRFDLLDEYSALVPFGVGSSRNEAFQDRRGTAKAATLGNTANFANRLGLLRRVPGALRQAVSAIAAWSLASDSKIKSPRRD